MSIEKIKPIVVTKQKFKALKPRSIFLFEASWGTNYQTQEITKFYVQESMVEQTLMELALTQLLIDLGGEDAIFAIDDCQKTLTELKIFQWANDLTIDDYSLYSISGTCWLEGVEITFIDKAGREYMTSFIDMNKKGSNIEKYMDYIRLKYKGVDFFENFKSIVQELMSEMQIVQEKRGIEKNIDENGAKRDESKTGRLKSKTNKDNKTDKVDNDNISTAKSFKGLKI